MLAIGRIRRNVMLIKKVLVLLSLLVMFGSQKVA